MTTLWTPPGTKAHHGSTLWPLPDVLPIKGSTQLKHHGEWMPLGYQPSGEVNRAKVFRGPHDLMVLVSLDERDGFGPLLHMSMSVPKGYPDWDLIFAVTRAVFGEHVDAMLPIPREEAYIHGATADQKSGRTRQVFHVIEMPAAWPRED